MRVFGGGSPPDPDSPVRWGGAGAGTAGFDPRRTPDRRSGEPGSRHSSLAGAASCVPAAYAHSSAFSSEMYVQSAASLVSQSAFHSQQYCDYVFSVAIGLCRSVLPVPYGAGHSTAKLARIYLTKRFIQIVISVLAFCLSIEIRGCDLLNKPRGGYWTGSRTRRSE